MNDDIHRLERRIDSLALRLKGLEDLLGVREPGEEPAAAPSPPEPAPFASPPAPVFEAPGSEVPHFGAAHGEPPPIPDWAFQTAEDSALEPISLAATLLDKSQREGRPRAEDEAEVETEPADQPAATLAPLEAAAAITHGPARTTPPGISFGAGKPRQMQRDLERLIGGRWYAVIGALAVVIGIGLFFKLGYDRGWFHMAPLVRCSVGALFGLSLLGTGEWVRRKVNNLAAAGIFSAGLGTVYASVYAAYRLYDLLPQVAAFALLAATALLGVFVAARTRLVFVAILSLVAGYLTPFLLASDTPRPMVLPAYLLMLLAVGLILCARMGRAFAPVRTVVWWATLGIGALWEISQGIREGGLGAGFAMIVWAAMHAELIFSAGHWGLQRAEGRPPADTTRPGLRRWSPLVSSFSTTAWATTFGAMALEHTLAPSWIAPAAGLAACGLLATVLASGLRGLTDKPTTDSERLGACLWVQAAGLLFATIALALAGWAEAACWIALGLSAIVASRWLRARAFDIYGLGVLAFCVVRLVIYDSWAAGLAAGGTPIAGLILSGWTLLMAIAAAAWLAASRLIVPRGAEAEGRFAGAWRVVSDLAACIGIGVLGTSLVHKDMTGNAFAGVLLATAAAAVAWGRGFVATRIVGYGVAVLALATTLGGLLQLNAWTGSGEAGGGLSFAPTSIVLLASAGVWACLSVMLRFWRSTSLRVWGVTTLALSDFSACVCFTLLPIALLHANIDATLVSVLFTLSGVLTIAWARVTRSEAGATYAAVLASVGAASAVTTAWWVKADPGALRLAGLVFTSEAIAPLLCGGVGFIIAIAWAKWQDRAGLANATLTRAAPWAAGIAAAILGLGLCHSQMAAVWAPIIPLALGAVCLVSRRAIPPLRLETVGAYGLGLSGPVWLFTYLVRGWPATDQGWFIHPGLLAAAAIIAAWEWAARLSASEPNPLAPTRATWRIGAVVLAFVATSFEVARVVGQLANDPDVRSAAVSIWWGLFAFGLIGTGFWKRLALARRAGLALLAAAALKALLLDLAGAPAGWRVASFIGLGLLMLGVAVVYQKMAAREEGDAPIE